MFATRFWTGFKKAKSGERTCTERSRSSRTRKVDTVADQVRQILQTADQQLILMVRS